MNTPTNLPAQNPTGFAAGDRVSPPVMLSTGRMIVHTRLANGAEGATPNKGPAELTEAEWAEYTQLITNRMAERGFTPKKALGVTEHRT